MKTADRVLVWLIDGIAHRLEWMDGDGIPTLVHEINGEVIKGWWRTPPADTLNGFRRKCLKAGIEVYYG